MRKYKLIIFVTSCLVALVLLATLYFDTNSLSGLPIAAQAIDSSSKNISLSLENNLLNGAIIGSVTSIGEKPLLSATVCAIGNSTLNQFDKLCVDVEKNGEFTFELAEGSYQLTASANNHESSAKSVILTIGELRGLHFDLELTDSLIAGKVVNVNGEALAGVEIEIQEKGRQVAHVKTDDKGEFSAWSPLGPVQVVAIAPGYSRTELLAYAPARDLRIRLFPGYSIIGQVINADTKLPVANVRVVAANNPVAPQHDSVAVVSNSQGRFQLNGLLPGKHFIKSYDDRWVSSAVAVTLNANNATAEIELVAQPGRSLAGRLIVEDGPCSSGSVYLYSLRDNSTLELIQVAPASIAGEVEFAAVTPSNYWLSARCKEHVLVSGPNQVDLTGTKQSPLEWHFMSGTGLKVVVRDVAGRPINSAGLLLKPIQLADKTQAGSRDVTTDKNGFYQFGGLSEGSYSLEVGLPGMSAIEPIEQTVKVVAGAEPEQVDVVFSSGGGIEIDARSPRGDAVSQLSFYAVDEGGKRYEAAHFGDGLYKIDTLPIGRYQVFSYDSINPEQALSEDGDNWITINGTKAKRLSYEYKLHSEKISGVVVDHNGIAVEGARVIAASDDIPEGNAGFLFIQEIRRGPQGGVTGSEGDFVIPSLSGTSSYRLNVFGINGVRAEELGVLAGSQVVISLPAPESVLLNADDEDDEDDEE